MTPEQKAAADAEMNSSVPKKEDIYADCMCVSALRKKRLLQKASK
jgi:hypothetical protein